jgi:CubicO group peptidase (beta-lactamase class C family)
VAPWLTGVALALLAVAFDAPQLRAQIGDSLTTGIAQALSEEGLVGATWALVMPEATTLGAAGFKDVSRNAPMSPHDRVQVGSLAKTLIATGVLRLITERRVALDSPVARYLPDVPLENPWEATSPLLVRHLLDHTGGLDDARMWQVFSLRASSDAPLRKGLVRPGGSLRVRHRPGERCSYSNIGFHLLGMLIEAVTGTRYEVWLDTALLAPLEMTRSALAFVTQTGPQGDTTLAMGHFDPRTTSAAVPIHLRPAGQFTTTANDMARLARFLMSDGRVEGRVLVDSLLLRGMAVPTTTEAARAGLPAGYALGLMRRDRHGAVGQCHLGNSGTFRAALCLFREENRAFFISHNVDPETANFDRIDAMLVRALGMPSLPERPAQPPGLDPVKWEGRYVVRPHRFAQFAYLDEIMGVTRVRWDGRALHLLPMQGTARTLTPVGGKFFRAADRREATHALLRSTDDRPIITDGLRTFERVPPLPVYVLWTSAAAGLAALLYLLIVGGVRSVRSLRLGAWRSEPLLWPTLCLTLLLVAPALYLTQSFLAIGDPTPASVAIALLTGTLPLTLLAAGAQRVRAGLTARTARLDLLALAGALQWCAVLASWGMLPFALWR